MKNLVEALTSIILVCIISFIILSLVFVESSIINNRNIFYQKYETALVNDEFDKKISHFFEIDIPFIGGKISYTFEGYTR